MAMETYYRKRSKKALNPSINSVTEMECFQKAGDQRDGEKDAGKCNLLSRHHLVPLPPASDHCALLLKGDEDEMRSHVELGAFYEIDHIHLPQRSPIQLRSVRVAMVCEKTKLNVAVRFPSMESLSEFFSYSKREAYPTLDEKFVMAIDIARRVLFRLVPAEKFSQQKGIADFWFFTSSVGLSIENVSGGSTDVDCLSELKRHGMVRWGIRRQVKYLGRHSNCDGNDDDGNANFNAQNSSSSFVNGFEDARMKLDGGGRNESGKDRNEEENVKEEEEDVEENEGSGEEDEEYGENEEGDQEKICETDWNLKRRRYSSRTCTAKKVKKENPETSKKGKQKQIQQGKRHYKNRSRFKESHVLRNPKDRWSSERYKLAEKNLLEVMKVKEAKAEKPILRPQLRAEARKRIGDTGLLDHLLKHMAGKLAPGGKERFRRRHNADGAMEYWLESAELVNIRRDAGITDPYWVPPPGWTPGDSPTQDPICAKELRLLKDDISKIKRDMELMATKLNLEQEIFNLRRELDELSSRKSKEAQSVTLISDGKIGINSQKLDQLATISLVSPKCGLESKASADSMADKYKEQLMAISEFVKEMEKKIGKLLTPNEEERPPWEESALIAASEYCTEKKKKREPENGQAEVVQEIRMGEEEKSELVQEAVKMEVAGSPPPPPPEAEQKAAKIQRLKSGFRICKPQGTFLWPNMAKNSISDNISMSPQVVVQVDHIPTPPSVSSTPSPFHLYHHRPSPPPPVKPLAERRAVTVSVPKDSNITTATMINLNNAPANPDHHRHVNNIPDLASPAADSNRNWVGSVAAGITGFCQKQEMMKASYSSSASSLANSEVANWLALSTLKSASDESSRG